MKNIIFILLILIAIVLQCHYLVYLNTWRGEFWQEIGNKDSSHFWIMIAKFSYAAFILVYSSAAMTWLVSKLALNIRKHYTTHYLSLFSQFYTRKSLTVIDNPEERLTTDLNTFTSSGLGLITGIIFNISRFLVFSGLLLMLSMTIFHTPYTLLLGNIGYCVLGVFMAVLAAYNLSSINYQNKATEASFRYGLSRTRNGLNDNLHNSRFREVINNNLRLFNKIKVLNIFTGTYSQAAIIIPILFLVPSYFQTQAFTLGLLMQAISAFSETSDSLSFLVNNWASVAELKACYHRLKEFKQEFDK